MAKTNKGTATQTATATATAKAPAKAKAKAKAPAKAKLVAYQYKAPVGPAGKLVTHYGVTIAGKASIPPAKVDALAATLAKPGSAWHITFVAYMAPGGCTAAHAAAQANAKGYNSPAYLNKWRSLPRGPVPAVYAKAAAKASAKAGK